MVYQMLKKFLVENRYTQHQVAVGIGVSDQRMSAWLDGTVRLPADEFVKICNFLKIKPSLILEAEEPCKK